MEQSPFEKLIVTQLVRKFPVLYGSEGLLPRSQKSPPLNPVLNQMNPIHTLTPYFFVSFNIIWAVVPHAIQWLSYELNDWGSIPSRGRDISSSPPGPDRLWCPPSLLWNGYRGLFSPR